MALPPAASTCRLDWSAPLSDVEDALEEAAEELLAFDLPVAHPASPTVEPATASIDARRKARLDISELFMGSSFRARGYSASSMRMSNDPCKFAMFSSGHVITPMFTWEPYCSDTSSSSNRIVKYGASVA